MEGVVHEELEEVAVAGLGPRVCGRRVALRPLHDHAQLHQQPAPAPRQHAFTVSTCPSSQHAQNDDDDDDDDDDNHHAKHCL
eukprot:441545-Rhodomonas_salina.1